MLFEDFIMATNIGLFILASAVLSKYLIKLCRIYAPYILVDLSLFLLAKKKEQLVDQVSSGPSKIPMHNVYNILCIFFTILASGLTVQEGLVIF